MIFSVFIQKYKGTQTSEKFERINLINYRFATHTPRVTTG